MRVAIGADHAGFDLKEAAKAFLRAEDCEVLDVGTHSRDPVDYSDFAAADDQHVHVVVLDALVRRVGVVTYSGADSRDLARGDRGADPGAAHEDGTLRLAAANCLRDLARLVRVVDARLRPIGAQIDHVVPERSNLL